MKPGLVGFCIFILSSLVTCQKQGVDYYSLMMQHGCQKREPVLTESCKQAILAYGTIDVASFSEHKDALEKLLLGLHVLLHSPIAFPEDKKIFGLSTLKQAEMYDFIDAFVGTDNPNQAILNHVLSSAPSITYENKWNAATFYTHLAVSNQEWAPESYASILLHEARHKAQLHNVLCDNATDHELACDKGMDGPMGWGVGLLWGLLQGASQEPQLMGLGFSQDRPVTIAQTMIGTMQFIFSLPGALAQMKEKPVQQNYLESFVETEQLSFIAQIAPSRFHSPSTMVLFQGAIHMQAADFDKDKKIDIAITYPDRVDILQNQGNGSFLISSMTNIKQCKTPMILASVDIDGDTNVDLLLSCDTLRILWGNGLGGFPTSWDSYLSTDNRTFRIADFNKDNKMDIVTLDQNGDTIISLSNGRSFTSIVQKNTLPGSDPTTMSSVISHVNAFVVDINQDHTPDLIFQYTIFSKQAQTFLSAMLGRGDGTFAEARLIHIDDYSYFPIHAFAGDTKSPNWIWGIFLPLSASSSFGYIQSISNTDVVSARSQIADFPGEASPQVASLSDLNRDGIQDIIMMSANSLTLRILYGSPVANFRKNQKVPLERQGIELRTSALFTEDLNQDGLVDIAVLSSTPKESRLILLQQN